jgi:type II secretory ATPase GspE/PulE/Tfp pilus assembly ATPase PilB-like protein/transcriptional regulator with GAF, ATPase, and Fis domain
MSFDNVTSTINETYKDEVRELESWAAIAQSDKAIEPSLATLTANLEELFDCEAATLFSYDKVQRQLYSRNVVSDQVPEIRLDLSTYNIAGFVAATGNPLNIKNVHSKSELSKNNRELLHDGSWDEKLDFETQSMLVIPLSSNGTFVGVMELINKISDTHFSDTDFLKARAISSLMAQVLIRLDKVHPAQNNGKKHNLKNITQVIQTLRTMDEVYFGLTPLLTSMFEADEVRIYTLNQDTNELFSRFNGSNGIQEVRLPMTSENPIGLAAQKLSALNIQRAEDPEEIKKVHAELTPEGMAAALTTKGSCLIIPLPHRNKIAGVLQLLGKQKKSSFTSKDEKNGLLIGESLSHAIVSRKTAYEAKPSPYGLLLQNGLLQDEELKEFQKKAEAQKESLEVLLRRDHFLLASDIGKSLEYYYGTPYFPYDETLDLPDPSPWKLKKKVLAEQVWVPIRHEGKQVTILAHNPKDPAMLEAVAKVFEGFEVDYRVGLSEDILSYFEKLAPRIKEEPVAVPNEKAAPLTNATPTHQETSPMTSSTDSVSPGTVATPAPKDSGPSGAIGQFNETLVLAGQKGVTDIHIEPNMETKNILVRLRKDGACRIFDEISGQHKGELIQHIKKLANLDLDKTKVPQSGQVEWSDRGMKLGLNVVVLPTIGDNEDITIQVTRLSKPKAEYMPLEAMHYSEPNLARINTSLKASSGLILVTGPQDSGKTTTLHAFLGRLNSPEKKVVTVEDPVDIVQNGLRQLLISPESGLNYASALKMLMMGSPDTIMVGAMPDAETLSAGMAGAENHLVLSSLDATSATDALSVLRDTLKADTGKLAETLTLVVALKPVTSLCSDCKADHHPTQEEFDQLAEFYGKKFFPELGVEYSDKLVLKKPVGCKKCLFSGYGDKTLLQEVLVVTDEMKALIKDKAPEENILSQAIKDEMITLNQDGVYKVFTGDCDFKQVQAAFKA